MKTWSVTFSISFQLLSGRKCQQDRELKVILLFATTRWRQHAGGVKIEGSEICTCHRWKSVKEQSERWRERKKKHHVRVACDIPQKLEHKEPERSSPGSVCGTLTWSSLYTELITVMQRAQFSSNKARERLMETEEEKEKRGTGRFLRTKHDVR